jgi:hypothetical protein
MAEFRSHFQIEVGDSFSAPGGTVRVTRRARSGVWVDVLVIQEGEDGAVWSKRMPMGIPSDWPRLARR